MTFKKTNKQTVVLVAVLRISRNSGVHDITNYGGLTLSQALSEPQEFAPVTTPKLQMKKQRHRWLRN